MNSLYDTNGRFVNFLLYNSGSVYYTSSQNFNNYGGVQQQSSSSNGPNEDLVEQQRSNLWPDVWWYAYLIWKPLYRATYSLSVSRNKLLFSNDEFVL